MHPVEADVCKTTGLLRDIQKQLRRQCYHMSVRLGTQKKNKQRERKREEFERKGPQQPRTVKEKQRSVPIPLSISVGPAEHHPRGRRTGPAGAAHQPCTLGRLPALVGGKSAPPRQQSPSRDLTKPGVSLRDNLVKCLVSVIDSTIRARGCPPSVSSSPDMDIPLNSTIRGYISPHHALP